jgi:flagellar assembly protein FliH
MSNNRVVSRGQGRAVAFPSLPGDALATGSQGARRRVERESLESVEREAFQKGFEAGRTSGLEMAEKKVEAILGRFAESLKDLTAAREQLLVETQKDLVRLAIEIARRLVYREIGIDQEIVIALVRVALERLSAKAHITVFLNPDDQAFLQRRLKESPDLFGERELVLKPKKDLKRGDCILESPYGNVDSRVCEHFSQIERGLLAQF